MEFEERYLGDGVYASFDGYQIWLDTRAQFPVNRIALEPGVWQALKRYVTDIGRSPGEGDMDDSENTSTVKHGD